MSRASLQNGLLRLALTIGLVSSLILVVSSAPSETNTRDIKNEYDVVIYGSTIAAIAAAVQVKRMKKTVAIVSPTETIGGLTTSGLGWTDAKNGDTIGGIAREFYNRIYTFYQTSGWKYESRDAYLKKSIDAQPGKAIVPSKKVQWTFEPKVAEAVLEKWIKDGKIPVFRNEPIDRSGNSVTMDGTTITSFRGVSGRTWKAKMFIDASYTGDLMEQIGVPYRTGREGSAEYNEDKAGFVINNPDLLTKSVSPYVKKGDGSSGLIAGIDRVLKVNNGLTGTADSYRLQAYNYRLCLTTVASNRVPFNKPRGYQEATYELLFRYIEAGYKGPFFTTQLMPNLKTDSNAEGEVSTDLFGDNYNSKAKSNYALYSYKERQAVAEEHKTYTQGFLWTLANHNRIPKSIRQSYSNWGYAKDEFTANGNFPNELYIREARRMKGIYTMTQRNVLQPGPFPRDTSIATGSYYLDVHAVERVLVGDKIYTEGAIHTVTNKPFPIAYNSIIPAANVARNFLNPVTMSATHVAYAAIRMEPAYMQMGQSAGTAAVHAIQQKLPVQDIDRNVLNARLRADKQVLTV
ncbi:hypothetical protein FZEAL_5172 [Fusarium zealandicum]|uniref:Xanthan lyase n=1 Tax=Fusarium zealandicum TaxID=1053134 RepID=A0A8H4UL96_9HYPO|nr:hypothetical protein FZEAL_5172 [Fusarium zealandicum]